MVLNCLLYEGPNSNAVVQIVYHQKGPSTGTEVQILSNQPRSVN